MLSFRPGYASSDNWLRRFKQTGLAASERSHTFDHLEDGQAKLLWQWQLASVSAHKSWSNSTTIFFVLAPQLPIDHAVTGEKQSLIPEPGAVLSRFLMKPVPRDQKVIRGLIAVHIQTHQRPFSENDGMHTVGHEILHTLHPGQRAAVFTAEPDVAADFCNRAAGLRPANAPRSGYEPSLLFDRQVEARRPIDPSDTPLPSAA